MKSRIEIREVAPEYAWREYGLTRQELEAFVRRTQREIAADRRTGQLRPFKPDAPNVKPSE